MPKVKPRITEDEHCRLGGVEGEALQVVLGDHGCRWHVLAAWRNAAQLDEVDDPLEVDQRRCLLDGGATACGPSQRWLALAFKAPDLALRPAPPVWLPLRWLPLPAPASASAAPASLLQMQASHKWKQWKQRRSSSSVELSTTCACTAPDARSMRGARVATSRSVTSRKTTRTCKRHMSTKQ